MERTLLAYVRKDLLRKIILVSGPRQSGKTTLARMVSPGYDYLNYDAVEDRIVLKEKSWDRAKEVVIFDELHKMKNWKAWLKGVYDKEGIPPALLVTGSAKMEISRKMGDSLAGRFFHFRLHPLDLKEIHSELPASARNGAFKRLLRTGGFPEPYLENSEEFYNRWKKSHLDVILRQDLLDLEHLQQISSIETLIQLLRSRVGSSISYSSLARDLECSDKTVKRWLSILENVYVIFRVPPYHRNVARAILKAPKYYLYDTGQVLGDEGTRLENLVACALLKEIHFRQDCHGEDWSLSYLRTKEGKEIDFLLIKDGKPHLLMEVKWADDRLSPALVSMGPRFAPARRVQLVGELEREKTFPENVEIRRAEKWLAHVNFAE